MKRDEERKKWIMVIMMIMIATVVKKGIGWTKRTAAERKETKILVVIMTVTAIDDLIKSEEKKGVDIATDQDPVVHQGILTNQGAIGRIGRIVSIVEKITMTLKVWV